MKILRAQWRLMFLLLLAAATVALTGCASTEPENASVRPWNSPKGWENGLPSSMTEGH